MREQLRHPDPDRRRRFTKIRGDKEHVATAGYTCNKALRLDHYQNGGARLPTPLRREPDGSFTPIDWDTAIREIAARLKTVRDTHGGESIFFYGGVALNTLTDPTWRDAIAGTPWHKHVPARIQPFPPDEHARRQHQHHARRTTVTTTDLTAMTGLELMRWMQAERPTDIPSIGRLLGMRFDEVDHGRIVISLDTRPDFANPLGTVHGGIAATLLDSVMGCAVHTTLPAGSGYTTLELKVNYIRAARTDGQILTAEGNVIHAGRRTATAEGKVLDDQGKLIAHATTTCMIL